MVIAAIVLMRLAAIRLKWRLPQLGDGDAIVNSIKELESPCQSTEANA